MSVDYYDQQQGDEVYEPLTPKKRGKQNEYIRGIKNSKN